ncbi:hypothetical protein SAMN02910356_00329 [Selenomonas sp. GACV-9]|nr:hypothetical protein SAMN02910356_00329 [Selenomonas ruminantium]
MKFFLYLIGFVIMILAVAFQGGNVTFWVHHELREDFSTLWYPVKQEQIDGKIFSVELPVEPKAKHTKYEDGSFACVDTYAGDREGVNAIVIHTKLRDKDAKLAFHVEDFKRLLSAEGDMQVKGEGSRTVQDKTLHNLECTYRVTGTETEVQMLGFQEGQDAWWLVYQYRGKDEAAKAKVENSIETIMVQ